MLKSSCVSFAALLVFVSTAGPAFAQPNVSRSAIAVGGTVGPLGATQGHSGGGPGVKVSGFVEVPVRPAFRVRLGAGTLHWHPTEPPRPGVIDAERVSLDHLTVTVLRSRVMPTLRFPVGVYTGVGAGYYRYRVARGPFTRGDTRGLQLLGGIEYQTFDRSIGLRFEVEMHLVGGPRHDHVWAEVMPTCSASFGISKRF